jgi:chemotaxis protein histidine kinase CheA
MSAAPQREQPAASTPRQSLVGRVLNSGRATLAAVAATLAALAGIVTNWHTIKSALLPTAPATEAKIVAGVEPDISRQEYDLQAHPPIERPASSAALAPGGPARSGVGYRFAVYFAPAGVQPSAGRSIAVASEEEAKGGEPTTTVSAEQKIKQEGEKITEEAKRDEEEAAREQAEATAEQKSAEAREQEEQKKEQEAQKRAEESQRQDAPQAKTEEAKARKRAQQAKSTVRAKRREAARTPTQRRIEVGTSTGRVEEVLHAAHLPESCQSTCALKPIVEKVLKSTAGDAAQAAKEVRTVAASRSGARVHFDVTLKGLERKVVVLTYSLVQTNGAPPPAPYLDTVAVKTFAPAHQREVVVGSCWVPVPSSSQRYYIELTVYDGKTEVAYKDTSPFR